MFTIRNTLMGIGLAAMALGAGAAGAREVTHSMGTADVPDSPQRVVVLTNEGTEAVLALGIKPVAAATSFLGDPWYEHIAEQMTDVTPLGTESAIDLELLASLEPDLILANKMRHEKIYEQLSAIAPTVVSERLRGDWQVNFSLYADALNKQAEGEALLADYNDRLGAISEQLGHRKAEKISLARFMGGMTRIYFKDTFAGLALSQIGFARPEAQDKAEFAEEITKERIPEFEGDRLFYYVYETGDGEGDKQAQDWLSDPLWQNLEVVKAGKAYPVSDAIWNTAGGYLAANLMLDDIEKFYELTPTR